MNLLKSILRACRYLLITVLALGLIVPVNRAQGYPLLKEAPGYARSNDENLQRSNFLSPGFIPAVEQTYLKASNTEISDTFGYSVAISGDTVVVGAHFEDSNATGVNGNQTNHLADDSGAAYVFVYDGTSWSQQAYLKASNTEADDHFGSSVSISGNTIAVGALGESSQATGVNGVQTDNSAADSGAVYIFTRVGGVWSQQAYLKASNTEADDQFGCALSIAGDTIAIGAQYEDSSATGINGNQTSNSAVDSGAVYIFSRNAGVWTQQAYLKASNTNLLDYFGRSVSMAGDTVAVGAYGESSNATGVNGNQSNNSAQGAGATYIFTRNVTTWTQQAYLKASNTESDDQFGYSVAISGDTVAVGAYMEDSNAIGVNGNQTSNSSEDAGAVYVFTRTSTIWSQQAYLKASNTEANDNFGGAVAISGDRLIVGANPEDSNAKGENGDQFNNLASNAGAVYAFDRENSIWNQLAYLKATNSEDFDNFGLSLAISGVFVAVGAPGEDSDAVGINGNQMDNSAFSSGSTFLRKFYPYGICIPYVSH